MFFGTGSDTSFAPVYCISVLETSICKAIILQFLLIPFNLEYRHFVNRLVDYFPSLITKL